jgi:hypothetical protein
LSFITADDSFKMRSVTSNNACFQIFFHSSLLSFVGQDEQHEIQRQNRITEQILSSFFERKFFPNRKPKPAPTIDEILPPESRANPSILKHKENDDDEPDTDNLQSVESEHVDSFYRDYPEGRCKVLKHLGDGCLAFSRFSSPLSYRFIHISLDEHNLPIEIPSITQKSVEYVAQYFFHSYLRDLRKSVKTAVASLHFTHS